ncbi:MULTISPECIES: LysE family translocator [Colwellia]|uniref:Transporter, LysE family n=1 Tax=Colwellia psychrerythraea (strain 34H / ATCC BAA-681) TaxID=167879 RepID=Q47ZU2_COLP3|nr:MULTISPECIES: LysE family translocator [Colwellia]AAZ25123.1 transporter, LysE family [Colwellia psychrerythraea 34H]PKH87314.1 LysE family translocator [Colwellia sp. Bg11-28]
MPVLEQFLLIAMVHFLAVASPGPDFALILKQSIRYNRRIAIYTSFGIAAGIIVHVTYSLVGIGLLIASDERLFTALKYIAASYFCYIAWHCFKSKKPDSESSTFASEDPDNNALTQNEITKTETTIDNPSAKKAFFSGFLINALNVKATLFFVSLFSVVIAPETLLSIKIAYGAYLVVATAAWFCFLSYMLTQERVRYVLQRKGYILDRIMGLILLLLAIQLVLSDLN